MWRHGCKFAEQGRAGLGFAEAGQFGQSEEDAGLRIVMGLGALAMLAACGGEPQEGAAPANTEVTVLVPPPAPPLEEGSAAPAGQGGGGVSGAQAAWAGVLRRVGFPCDRITSVRETGNGTRVDCAGGGPYRATRRDGRIKFSRWRSA
jgi:hypothetical protein